MLGVHDLALFVVSGLLLNITPGQDVAYIVSRSAAHGLRDGAVAALGIGTGCFVHVFAAALGLSAILATSATAFLVVKLVGAAYLVYVGAAMLLGRGNGGPARRDSLDKASARKVFSQGFLTNALNPKVALFFLAFLPQFVDAGAGSRPMAFLLLGVIFTFNGTLINLLWAWSAARLSTMLGGGGRFGVWIKRAVGTLFISFGIRLALAE
ncbi:MAG: LysE family translocator [Pseudodesulfovibrio sp.]|uniref:Lysine exporter protein (LYSE/YGGA) n=1 Tax=Pseudodesulfovibrio aespoeensis (strain ATCC 700646 / DSM 10631 / Aspo-2) TaxID=643562 RepID=E6VSE0_PSEA9|nr:MULTISPECIES: LysE family translocator [Pseudodesulfovibrio]MBU4192298.1 LysE family translocator [Pseudomonadota bacterium]ADU64283.1 Lysine exporter protein (LYSE/YGGA) [Pseudodesulfovibrio aespoeensis Aspo-2]MBU4243679.1 LysE family translocator [Pseudomonadota bacterium]MBU4378405.1 LysE family translocator [Pseudomonadota bacterium]MBU4475647.1 LysE family translocator [Pseudomonadota bacterium]